MGNRAVARLAQTADATLRRKPLVEGKLNVAGEEHRESGGRRREEQAYAAAEAPGGYWTESEFSAASGVFTVARNGDPSLLRVEMRLAVLKDSLPVLLDPFVRGERPEALVLARTTAEAWTIYQEKLWGQIEQIVKELTRAAGDTEEAQKAKATHGALITLAGKIARADSVDDAATIAAEVRGVIRMFASDVLGLQDIRSEDEVSQLRSQAMNSAASDNAARWVGGEAGLWKVGEDHVAEMQAVKGKADYELMSKNDFNEGFERWREKRQKDD